MPSAVHEVVIAFLGDVPDHVLAVLRRLGVLDAVDGMAVSRARRVDGSVQPQLRTARSSDLVIEVPHDDGRVRSVIIEMQQEVKPLKRGAWALYWAAAFERTGCGDVWMVVITTEPAVVRWAQRALFGVIPPEGRFVVLGPGTIPRIEDPEAARQDPEAAALSAMIYAGQEGDDRLAPAIVAAYSTLPTERAMLIDDVIRSRLSQAALLALEELMRPAGYEWQSDFARTHRAEGHAEGHAEGRLEGQHEMLLALFETRGFEVTSMTRGRILACRDSEQLERWLRRAVRADSIAQVFVDVEP